jgi:hypothetical protein
MIAQLQGTDRKVWEPEVFGLVAKWSRTHGTEYTLSKAREAGLATSTVEYES